MLKGDASNRRFWRVAVDATQSGAASAVTPPVSAIAVDLGPDDLPRYVRALNLLPSPVTEPPWINVHRFLTSIGAPVAALYDADPARRAMLVEDVGETSLLDAVRRPGADAADLFRLAASELHEMHVHGLRDRRAQLPRLVLLHQSIDELKARLAKLEQHQQ